MMSQNVHAWTTNKKKPKAQYLTFSFKLASQIAKSMEKNTRQEKVS